MKTFRCEMHDKVKTVEAMSPTSAVNKAFRKNYSTHWEEVDEGEHHVEVVEIKTGQRSFVAQIEHG